MKNTRKIIIAAVLAILAIFIIATVFRKPERQLTVLERNAIKEFSDKAMAHMEEIDFDTSNVDQDNKSNPIINGYPLDRYIAYALEYSYEYKDKSELSVKDVKKTIASIFDVKLDEKQINNVGVSPYLLDKHIDHEPVAQKYSIRKDFDKRQIADIKITKYILGEMKVNEDSTLYTVTYNKYTAKSPYDVLPHSTGSNAGVNDYLNGKGKISSVKALITPENAESITGVEKQTTVEYIIKDDQLRIKSIQ